MSKQRQQPSRDGRDVWETAIENPSPQVSPEEAEAERQEAEARKLLYDASLRRSNLQGARWKRDPEVAAMEQDAVTGGAGALGLFIAQRLLRRGVRKLTGGGRYFGSSEISEDIPGSMKALATVPVGAVGYSTYGVNARNKERERRKKK